MGLLEGIGDFFDTDFGGQLLGIGGSLASGMFQHDSASDLIAQQQAFTEKMMKSKHQWEIEDLKAAGLNPVLSAIGKAPMGSSGAASGATMDNPAIASASMLKTRADIGLTKQTESESKSRQALVNTERQIKEEERKITAAKAIVEKINAIRKQREFSAVDQTDFGKRSMPPIESLPPYLRGPARFGFTAAKHAIEHVKGAAKWYGKKYSELFKKGKRTVKRDVDRYKKKRKEKEKDFQPFNYNKYLR